MKTVLLIVGLLAFLIFPAHGESYTKIRIDGHDGYIIPREAAGSQLTKKYGPSIQKEISGYWTPTTKDVETADRAIRQFIHLSTKDIGLAFPERLKNPEKYAPVSQARKEIGCIEKNLDRYSVQFIGYTENDKKLIFANYFDVKGWRGGVVWQGSLNPEKVLIDVLDGGYAFWQVRYDVETKGCTRLEINGPWEPE